MHITVCLALIHNNNGLRNAYIRPQLEGLIRSVETHILAEKIEVSFQSEIIPHSMTMAFIRDVIYWRLGRKWQRYRLSKARSLLRDGAGFLKRTYMKYIVNNDDIGKRWQKNSAIEVMVTEKHVRAWGKFLDSGADFLICFEDDAVFKDDSIQKISKLLNTLSQAYSNSACYVDLSGGCHLSDLGIENLEENQDELYRYYSKPVTNTACAYLMSRQLVARFHAILAKRPWLRLIGIDWMMNSLFIRMENDGAKCICMHADPTIVKHGTTTGEYISWQIKES